MKQSISRRQFLKASGLAAAGACAAGLLSSCGGKSGGSSSGSASGADTSKYTVLYSSQPATLNYLTTATDLEMVVGANCVDTLVEYDNKGVMREGLATIDYPPTKTYGPKQRVVDGVHMKSNTGSLACYVRVEEFGPGTYFDVGYPVRRIYKRLFIRRKG